MSNTTTATNPRWTEYLPIDDLPDAPTNPKTHQRDAIATSIQTFNLISGGIALDERTGQLIGGHGTRDTLRELRDSGSAPPEGVLIDNASGQWLVPVQRGWSSKDDHHAAAAGIALNSHTINGGWNTGELLGVLDELTTDNPALTLATGYDDHALEALRAQVDAELAADGLDPFPAVDHYDEPDTNAEPGDMDDAPDVTMQPLARSYGVLIHAQDEQHQKQLMRDLTEMGYKPVTMT